MLGLALMHMHTQWHPQLQAHVCLLYVCFKFVRQKAVGIYYISWPPKKIAAQISYQVCLPKTAQISAACTANWPKLPKNKLQKNICYKDHNPWNTLYYIIFKKTGQAWISWHVRAIVHALTRVELPEGRDEFSPIFFCRISLQKISKVKPLEKPSKLVF